MKQLFLIILFIGIFSVSSFAQLYKGMWLVGGSGSFYSYDYEYKSATLNNIGHFTEIDLNASIGYLVVDKLSLGLVNSFSYYKGEIYNGGEVSRPTKILFGPYVRYYFLKSEKPFNLLTDLNYQFGIYKDASSYSNYKGKLYSYSLMGGTEVFFNSTAGLELLFGYKQTYEALDENPSINSAYKRSGLFFNIGFKLHLEKK